MKKLLLISAITLFSLSAFSQIPNWSENISCILYSHCTSCHNPNGIAPMSLITYTDAVDNATGIRDYTQSRTMPPFLADINYQQYAHQKTLTQMEINEITAWVNNSTPSGDTALAPAPPTYSQGAVITNPDFSSVMTTYNIPLLINDMYRCFVISNPFTTDKYITGIEVLPGNRAAVHHVLIYSDDSNVPVNLDNADTLPGYVSFTGTGSLSSVLLGGYVPGSEPYFLPPNMGMRVTAGSRIIIQVHYPLSASGLTDSTRVNFVFSPVAVRPATTAPVLNYWDSTLVDGPLFIPANTVKTFHEQYTVPYNVSVLSVLPHAHLVCTSLKSYAVKPGNDTINFENIPRWDFHWQGSYYFQKPILLPAGTVVYGEATYDNTTNNPNNPNQPPQNVWAGESTIDEMMLFYFVYTPYFPGDENITIDTTGHLPHYLNCTAALSSVDEINFENDWMYVFPNPAEGEFTIHFAKANTINSVEIYNLLGESVFSDRRSKCTWCTVRCALENGIYFIRAMNEAGKFFTEKLSIVR